MSDEEEANESSGSLVVTLDEEEGTPLTEVIYGAVGGAPIDPSGGRWRSIQRLNKERK